MYEYHDKVYDINIDDIEIDYTFNTRLPEQMELGDLITAIRAAGQKEAGKVMHQPNAAKPFKLLTGFRRITTIINHTDIKTYRAVVVPECTLEEQMKFNYIENQARKDLTLYDEARSTDRFLALGWTEKKIQDELGLSRGKIQARVMLMKMIRMESGEELENLAKADLLTYAVIHDLWSIKNHTDRVHQYEELKTKAKFKLKLSVDKNAVETKVPRDIILMERPKPARKRFMEFALGQKIPFCQWPQMFAWINGEINDKEFLDVLEEIKRDPCSYADFKFIIEEAEAYVNDPGSFLAKVLAFKETVKDLVIERPPNGIPFSS